MNLETRAQLAVQDVLDTHRDLETGLADLRRTRRRRAVGKAAAGCAIALGVVLAVVVWDPTRRTHPVPTAPPVRNGLVLSQLLHQVVQRVGGDRPPGMPRRVDPLGPFEFSSDGQRFVYSWHKQVVSVDLATGTEHALADCPGSPCVAAITADGTKLAISRPHAVEVRELATGQVRRIRVDEFVFAPTWSPDGRRIAYVGGRGRGNFAISVLDTDTGHVDHLAPLGESVGERPAWSPDGTTLAYIEHTPRRGKASILTLMTVPAAGGQPSAVHPLGTCYCIRYYPAVTWAPDGQWLAATLAGIPRPSQVGGDMYVVHPDGTGWRRLAPGTYQDRIAWQPLVTSSD